MYKRQEPVSGDADGRFDRLEEVKVGVPRGQLVGDGLDQVACPRTRLREVAEDDGLDGAEALVGPDQGPRVRPVSLQLLICCRNTSASNLSSLLWIRRLQSDA